MTPDKLNEIKARHQNAAEWTLVETSLSADGLWLKPEYGTVEQGVKLEDQTPFFSHVQNDMAELIAALEMARDEIERLEEELKTKEFTPEEIEIIKRGVKDYKEGRFKSLDENLHLFD